MSELITPKLSTPSPFVSQNMDDFFTPSAMIEVVPEEADRMGAFIETALSLEDALDANLIGESV